MKFFCAVFSFFIFFLQYISKIIFTFAKSFTPSRKARCCGGNLIFGVCVKQI
jgi:hypothetical protein